LRGEDWDCLLFIYRYAIFILYAGYIISPKEIPNYWVWLYRISPFTYGLEGLMINELIGTTYTCSSSETYPPAQYPLYNVSYPEGN
jgi:ABC-type multidrug transport system permease subunit